MCTSSTSSCRILAGWLQPSRPAKWGWVRPLSLCTNSCRLHQLELSFCRQEAGK